jgi:hypothetical protein
MPEVRMQIPEELVKKLQSKLGSDVKITDIVRDALTLFNWTVKAEGREILTNKKDLKVLAMPSLDKVPEKEYSRGRTHGEACKVRT